MSRSDRIRVLHVDDEPDFADVAATFLEREDDRLVVDTATSAAEGLDALDDGVDCVVSDYDMPGRNGIEFLEAVREDAPDLPFVLYTGKGSEEIASEAISAGVTDYLQKGSGTDQYAVLANRITNAVESYRSRRALADRNRDLRRYKNMVDSMREAACVYDEEGRFVVVNGYLADWYGTTKEALEGRRSDLVASIRDREDDPFRALVEGRREQVSGEIGFEFPGHGHAVVAYQLTPLMVDGTVEGVVGVARDVTERREREEELRRNERAMDEAPIGITITDPDRSDNPIVYANRRFRELTGYDESGTVGRNCRFLQGPDTDPGPVAAMREAIDAEERVTVELRNYRKGGSEFWNRVSIAPVRDEEGSVVNHVGFQRDVTEDHRRADRRRRQRETLVDLATDPAVADGDFGTAVRRITETAADLLDVPRVNVWLTDDDGDVLTCVDNYDREAGEHTRGAEIDPDEHPAYVEALRTHQVVDATDAREDPRTSELADYLDANGVGALLDGTLRSGGEVVGVVCHEHTGGPREWTEDDLDFAADVADVVHRALRNRERAERERELERTNTLLSTLFETLPVGVLVEDADRNVPAANERVFELFGLSGTPDEVVGADCERMARELSGIFERPAAFVERIDELVATREPVRDEELRLEDGRTFSRSHEPIGLPDGEGHLWVYRDVTERKDRERRLRETTSRLEALFEGSPDMIDVLDEDGRILDANRRFREELGYDEDELVSRPIWELDLEADAADMESLLSGFELDERRRFEGRYERRDGSTLPVEVHLLRLSLDGESRFLAISRDITERKERERERTRTIEFLQQLYEVATEAELNADAKITRLLRTGPERLGLPYGYLTRIEVDDDDLEGGTQTVVEASGNHDLLRPGETCPLSRSYCRKAIERDGLVAIRDAVEAGWEGDPAYETFDLGSYIGTTITVGGELYGTLFFASTTPRAEPFSDAERAFVRLAGRLVGYELERERDREELEAQAERIEEQYRTLFEEAPVMAVLTREEDGRPIIEDCNDQFVDALGYDHGALVGRELAELYTPESRTRLIDEGGYERSLAGEFTRERRTFRTADGGTVEALLRAVPRRDATGEVAGTLAMYVDVTERERIRRANERLDEFTSVVSHDLRNPLNVAEGRLELAREECDSDHLDDVDRAHDRMRALIDDLLALAREGEQVGNIESIDPDAVARKGWRNVETDDATLRVELDRPIRGDPSRLQQLFENLFRNCVEHGSTGSRAGPDDGVEHGGPDVTVTVGALSDGFYVADDGPGIPADERERVFEAGYSTSAEGTGFGLSIVRQVAEAHGWAVEVVDGTEGGARFEVTGVAFAD
ncbi:MAG: PAS domain S-box protein [Haloferacaceae archaeon]